MPHRRGGGRVAGAAQQVDQSVGEALRRGALVVGAVAAAVGVKETVGFCFNRAAGLFGGDRVEFAVP